MTKPQPSIPCPRCGGSGKINLTKALRSTLQAIQRFGRPTARQIHTALKERGHVSTSHRRLSRLVKLGMVKSHRQKINGLEVEATYSEVK